MTNTDGFGSIGGDGGTVPGGPGAIVAVGLGAGAIYSIFEAIRLRLTFPFFSLPGAFENALWNLLIFPAVGLAAGLLSAAAARAFPGLRRHLAPIPLAALIVFPVYFFLFSHFEGSGLIYHLIHGAPLAALVLAVPALLPGVIVHRSIAAGHPERFAGWAAALFFLINPGVQLVDWRALHRLEAPGAASFGIAAAASILLFLGANRIAGPLFRPPQPEPVRPTRRTARGRSPWLVLGGVVVLLGGLTLAGPGPRRRPPEGGTSILLIIMDTARADRFSCYGYGRETTPFLDAFSRAATLFPDAVSPAPWTMPSHASLFTGLYPSAHGATWHHQSLDERFLTLAELLRERGYATVGISNNPVVNEDVGLTQGFETYVEMWRDAIRNPGLPDRVEWFVRRFIGRADGGALRTNARVLEWLDRCYGGGRPFFLFLNYMECHLGDNAPDREQAKYLRPGCPREVREVETQDIWAFLYGFRTWTDREWRDYGDVYDGDLTYLDRRLGELLAALEARGFLDDTIVVITSDHGEHLGEHRLIDHQLSLYEPLLHVPLIIRVPGGRPRPVRPGRPVQTVDLYPTLLDMVGIEAPEVDPPLQGISLVDPEAPERAYAISEYEVPEHMIETFRRRYPEAADRLVHDRRLKSIRSGSMKYIWSSNGDSELFDLAADPGETTNLALQDTATARALETDLTGWLGSFEPADASGEGWELDAETRQHLRALGYID
jgi:arylsulfatase A-like enzyme